MWHEGKKSPVMELRRMVDVSSLMNPGVEEVDDMQESIRCTCGVDPVTDSFQP